ncbi:MAG TPA: cysteine desulfurase family protein [Bacillota bacterium]|nr:cysteine desulfurase family protein [Bacillota bacterium]
MSNLLAEIKNAISWEDLCGKFGDYLGLEGPAPLAVTRRTARDDNFARYLISARNQRDMLELLLKDPRNKEFELLNESDPAWKTQALKQTALSIYKWSQVGYQDPKEMEYSRRYQVYLQAEKFKNPETKSCKCTEIKVDEFREVYLDHNATTYIRPEVAKKLNDYHNGKWGYANPSSSIMQGNEAYEMLLDARKRIANCLSVNPTTICFTGSGSEANNLAIKGIAFEHLAQKGHLITSKVEHASVLEVMNYLETLGFSVTYLDVDHDGMVAPEAVQLAILQDTLLVSIMAANNEIGTINPITEIGQICRKRNIPFMVDAIQAFGKIPLNPKEMGISLLSFSGHKIYAPKGIGGLYVEQGLHLVPQIHGGGQESGLRSGTENVGAIIALGQAAELAHAEMETETKRLLELREFFLAELQKIEPDFTIHGSLDHRLPGNLNIGFPGVDSGALLRSLNRIGISVSTGSACSSKRLKTSHVLAAVGADTENYAAIRFGFGLETTREDLEYLFRYLPRVLHLLQVKEPEKIAANE